ncbi:MAG: hypothetical protein ACT4QG_01215 [Sporichthyaceae bacterium]
MDPSAAIVLVRADSAFYGHAFVAAALRGGARFSVTARMSPSTRAAIAAIEENGWVPIHYPNAFADTDTGELVSDAEVAEIHYTAFAGRRKGEQVTARLIVRRVKQLNPRSVDGEQDELFAAHRHHAVFTNSPMTMLQAEAQHRSSTCRKQRSFSFASIFFDTVRILPTQKDAARNLGRFRPRLREPWAGRGGVRSDPAHRTSAL